MCPLVGPSSARGASGGWGRSADAQHGRLGAGREGGPDPRLRLRPRRPQALQAAARASLRRGEGRDDRGARSEQIVASAGQLQGGDLPVVPRQRGRGRDAGPPRHGVRG